MSSMLSKLKQFKDLRSQAKAVQSTLSQEVVTGNGAGNKIAIVMDGNQKIQSVTIDPTLLSPEQKKKIEQGIIDAMAEATKQLQKIMAKKIQSGEMSLPDLSGLR